MRVLSLFDGMACGMLAMMEAGVKVDRYVAYEIDKYAIKTATHNFPQIEEKGDVFTADFTQYQGFDFLIGGSPCTYWSIAQKNNRETEASGLGWELFSQYVRALKEAKPKFFIYENNKSMSKAIRDSIRETFGFEEICINSALVSAQNRQRYYWVGKYNPETGWYDKVHVEQPEDRGILLKDVLDGVPTREKENCLAGNRGGMSIVHDLTESRHNLVAEPIRVGTMPQQNGALRDNQATRIYSTDGKSVTQSAMGGGWGAKTGLYAFPLPRWATPCEWDSDGIPTKAISGADGKTYTVYRVENSLITIKGKTYPIKLADGYYIIRKLTVSECKRLQTVPEWYDFSCVSDTQAYKMLGNGWTVLIICHLINSCKEAM